MCLDEAARVVLHCGTIVGSIASARTGHRAHARLPALNDHPNWFLYIYVIILNKRMRLILRFGCVRPGGSRLFHLLQRHVALRSVRRRPPSFCAHHRELVQSFVKGCLYRFLIVMGYTPRRRRGTSGAVSNVDQVRSCTKS